MDIDLKNGTCSSCGRKYKYGKKFSVFCDDCDNRDINMPDDRHLIALKRIRQQIADGLELNSVDSNDIGNKYTHCSWGLCSGNKEQWPDAEDHLWPHEFKTAGRVAPKYQKNHQHCPFDSNQSDEFRSGCFWTCMIFQGGLRDRNTALMRYDQIINAFELKVKERGVR